jgi:hypothetical protein
MLAPLFTLDQALARGEVLAERTHESTHVICVGEWVYKFLKPLGPNPRQDAKAHWRQIAFRVFESHRWPELNPLSYDERSHCLISRYVSGRPASRGEIVEVVKSLEGSGRGYLVDISVHNVLVTETQRVIIDFTVAEEHVHWRRRKAYLPAHLRELY